MTEMLPVFPTLRAVGYEACAHPRAAKGVCMDCGATLVGAVWLGGSLDHARRPLVG